jgi:hypothetical protein
MPDETSKSAPSLSDSSGTARRWTALRWTVVALMVFGALAYLVAVPLGGVPHDDRLESAEVGLGVALTAGFAFFGSLTQVDLTSAGLSFKIRSLERGQEALQSELNAVRERVTRLFLNTMAPSMYGQLLKLQAGAFTDYEKTKDFEREMTNLRDAGYVEDFDWGAIPNCGADLSDHISMTPLGEEFLALRALLAEEGEREPDATHTRAPG